MSNNIDTIEQLLNDLRENYNNQGAKHLAEWLKRKGAKGFGESTICNIKKGRSSLKKELDLIKHLRDFIKDLKENPPVLTTHQKKTLSKEILKSYRNQSFYMYHNGTNDDNGIERLSRVVLKIGKHENDVSLINVPHREATNYKGHFTLSPTNRHLIFHLQTAKNQEKLLTLTFIRPLFDNIPELMLGTYSNTDSKSALHIGTLVLVHQGKMDNKAPLKPLGIDYDTKEYEHVPKPIRDYLRNRWQNRIKVTVGINSVNKLGQFIRDYKKRNKGGQAR